MRIFTDERKRHYQLLRNMERGGTFQYETHQYMKIDPKCHGVRANILHDPDHVLVVNLKHGSCRTLQRDMQVLKTDAECHITIEE